MSPFPTKDDNQSLRKIACQILLHHWNRSG